MLRDYLIKDFGVKILFSDIYKKQLFCPYKSPVRGNLVISNGDISLGDIVFSDGDLN